MSVSITTWTPEEALAAAIKLLGGYAATSRLLGLKTAWAVQKWVRCPPHHVLALEAATKGVISRHQLRPDLYPEGAVAERSAGPTSILTAFFVGLAPADKATFEREINQASADGARGEDWIAAMHAIAVRLGASFSLEDLLAEWHADRWHAAAESSAWTWLPAEIRLLPGSRAVRDRQFAKAQTKGLEPAPIGPAPFDSGAAA